MKIGYLLNQYPYISCTFIRREIVGLEAQGIDVARFSIRSSEYDLVDERDVDEIKKTRFVLAQGVVGLLLSFFLVFLQRPLKMVQTLLLALRTGWRSDRGVFVYFVYVLEACIAARWCRELGITHVHSHFGTNSTAVAMFCNSLGGPPYSFMIHGPLEWDMPHALNLDYKIKRAAFVTVISSFARSQAFRLVNHTYWSKIHVVHCVVDEDFLGQDSPVPDSNMLVNVGRLGEQKGHLQLIEAARMLDEQRVDFKLRLIGDGPLRGDIERLVTAYNLDDKIELAGWATEDQIKQHLRECRGMVLPSFAEGLPVVIMEAFALGRPVISTYVAGIPELVVPGVNGWLIPAGSSEATASAMRELLEAPPSQLTAMGCDGASAIAREHNPSIETRKLAKLFQASHGELMQTSTDELGTGQQQG